jgi:hypothetical protein
MVAAADACDTSSTYAAGMDYQLLLLLGAARMHRGWQRCPQSFLPNKVAQTLHRTNIVAHTLPNGRNFWWQGAHLWHLRVHALP